MIIVVFVALHHFQQYKMCSWCEWWIVFLWQYKLSSQNAIWYHMAACPVTLYWHHSLRFVTPECHIKYYIWHDILPVTLYWHQLGSTCVYCHNKMPQESPPPSDWFQTSDFPVVVWDLNVKGLISEGRVYPHHYVWRWEWIACHEVWVLEVTFVCNATRKVWYFESFKNEVKSNVFVSIPYVTHFLYLLLVCMSQGLVGGSICNPLTPSHLGNDPADKFCTDKLYAQSQFNWRYVPNSLRLAGTRITIQCMSNVPLLTAWRVQACVHECFCRNVSSRAEHGRKPQISLLSKQR